MGLAVSNGTLVWGEFDGSTRANFVKGLAFFLLEAGWKLNEEVKPSVVGTFSGNVSNNQTLSAAGETYTWKNTINNSNAREVLRGGTLSISLSNMEAAINGGSGAGTNYSTPTFPNLFVRATATALTLTLTHVTPGPDGNGTTSTFGLLVGGGYKVKGESRQATHSDPDTPLSAVAYVYDKQQTDAFSNLFANVQMISSTDPAVYTGEKKQLVGTGKRFRVIASRCQYFVYREGIAADELGSVICGGVPFVPPPTVCSGEIPAVPVDEDFWVSSDAGGIFIGSTPRTVLLRQFHTTALDLDLQTTGSISDANGWGVSDGVFNGVVLLGGTADKEFRMVSMSPPDDFPNRIASGGTLVNSILWAGELPMKVEPLIAWSTVSSDSPRITGQLWDSWIITKQSPMDTVQYFDGSYWVAFTDLFKFGTLWLMVPSPEPVQFEDIEASYAH